MNNRFDRSARGTKAAAMTSFSSRDLLSLPIRLHDIELGRAIALIVDLETMRVLGLEVRCGDATHRFLPLAATRIGDEAIAIASSLLLLDELPFYRTQARSLQGLRGAKVDAGGVAVGTLADVLVRADGAIERIVVEGAAGRRRVPVGSTVRIEERRAPAA
jgi:hypothetical protein